MKRQPPPQVGVQNNCPLGPVSAQVGLSLHVLSLTQVTHFPPTVFVQQVYLSSQDSLSEVDMAEMALDSIHHPLLPLTAPLPQLSLQFFSLLVAGQAFRVANGHTVREDCGVISLISLFPFPFSGLSS